MSDRKWGIWGFIGSNELVTICGFIRKRMGLHGRIFYHTLSKGYRFPCHACSKLTCACDTMHCMTSVSFRLNYLPDRRVRGRCDETCISGLSTPFKKDGRVLQNHLKEWLVRDLWGQDSFFRFLCPSFAGTWNTVALITVVSNVLSSGSPCLKLICECPSWGIRAIAHWQDVDKPRVQLGQRYGDPTG